MCVRTTATSWAIVMALVLITASSHARAAEPVEEKDKPPQDEEAAPGLWGHVKLPGENGKLVGQLLHLRLPLLPAAPGEIVDRPQRPFPPIVWTERDDYLVVDDNVYGSIRRRLVPVRWVPPPPPPPSTQYDVVFAISSEVKLWDVDLRIFGDKKKAKACAAGKEIAPDHVLRLSEKILAEHQQVLRAELLSIEEATPELVADRKKKFPFQTVTPKAYAQLRINLLERYAKHPHTHMLESPHIQQVRIGPATSEGLVRSAGVDFAKRIYEYEKVEACLTVLPTIYVKIKGLDEWVKCEPYEEAAKQPDKPADAANKPQTGDDGGGMQFRGHNTE